MPARLVRLRGALALSSLVLALAPATVAQAAGPRTNSEQLPGETPVAAAIAWSQRTFAAGSADDVLLGRDDRFPDNLTSGAPQGVLDAPLLLNPSTRLHDDVSTELGRLGAVDVHILGGTGAISESVEQALRGEGYRTHRHSGPTRIDTAIAVAQGHAAGADTAIVARAFGTSGGDESAAWADALGAGGWAAETGWPVLLTESERLTPSVAAYLRQSNVKQAFVIGGTSAVSSQTVNELAALGIPVERVSGPNRFETATRIALRRGFDDATKAQRVILAEGEEAQAWAGGFTAAAHAKRHDAPVVLANGERVPPETERFLAPAGDTTALWCGPFTTTAACDQAGAQLDQSRTGQVSLDATSVARDGSITGTVAPLDDVTGVGVRGVCVSPQSVTLDAQGGFSVPVRADASATSCEVTFTVTHQDGRGVEQPFALTLGAAPTVTDAPELLRVDSASTTSTSVVLRYVFDEDVAQVAVTGGATAFEQKFRLVTPDTRLSFAADSARVIGTVGATVEATFGWQAAETLNRHGLATLAAVDGAAVQDRDTRPNVAAAFPLKTLNVAPGRTLGPDLVSVGNSGSTAGAFTYDFTLDQPLSEVPEAATFAVVLDDGSVSAATGTDAAVGKTVVRATFTSATASVTAGKVRRALLLPDAATPGVEDPDVCAEVEGARRCSDLHAVVVAQGGVTALPDLANVSLDTATGRVAYTFDEAVSSPVAARFVVVSFAGGQSAGTQVVGISGDARTVTVQFAAGVVDESLVSAGVLAGAVKAFGTDAAPDSVSFARSYAPGTVFGPRLADATATSSELLSGRTSHTVTFTFDMPITLATGDLAYDGFHLHSRRGDRVAADGCVRVADTQVRCDFTFEAGAGPAVTGTVARGSVVNNGWAAGGVAYPNPSDARRLPTQAP